MKPTLHPVTKPQEAAPHGVREKPEHPTQVEPDEAETRGGLPAAALDAAVAWWATLLKTQCPQVPSERMADFTQVLRQCIERDLPLVRKHFSSFKLDSEVQGTLNSVLIACGLRYHNPWGEFPGQQTRMVIDFQEKTVTASAGPGCAQEVVWPQESTSKP